MLAGGVVSLRRVGGGGGVARRVVGVGEDGCGGSGI